MFSLEVESDDKRKEILAAELWELGSTGIVEVDLATDRCLLRAFFEDEADAAALTARFGGRIERHPARDWVAVSRAGWQSIAVGTRFYLVPEWLNDTVPPGRLRIAINPGLACGTGYHEATQLCLEAMEKYQRVDMTVLDVGTGSGLLSVASTMLGARRVFGCDVDPVAVEIASLKGLPVFTGSVDAVRSGSCDLIFANINAAAAIELAGEFERCLAVGGRAIVSGFEAWETAAVAQAYGKIDRVMVKGEWRAVVASATRIELLPG